MRIRKEEEKLQTFNVQLGDIVEIGYSSYLVSESFTGEQKGISLYNLNGKTKYATFGSLEAVNDELKDLRDDYSTVKVYSKKEHVLEMVRV